MYIIIINNSIMSRQSGESQRKEIVSIQKKHDYNKFCADCNNRGTSYTDVKYGCFLCTVCAGEHRKLGTDICRVKSTLLDNYSVEELSMFTYTKGNKFFNEHYEALLSNYFDEKPVNNSNEYDIKKYITQKYVYKLYYSSGNTNNKIKKNNNDIARTNTSDLTKPIKTTNTINTINITEANNDKYHNLKIPKIDPPKNITLSKTNKTNEDLINFNDDKVNTSSISNNSGNSGNNNTLPVEINNTTTRELSEYDKTVKNILDLYK
mgnify:FL=1|jgi:hypothetical protein